MKTADFVSIDTLLSDILPSVDDVELRKGMSKGWYIGRIQAAIETLALETFFDERTLDIPFPNGTLEMPIPEGCFNITDMYVYSGACCGPEASQKVWWKKNYNNKGGDGRSYTANIRQGSGGTQDPFLQPYLGQSIYFANVQDRKIMFSPSCAGYPMVQIQCNGMGVPIGDIPIVPRFLRKVTMDLVRVDHYEYMMAREPKVWRIIYEECANALNNGVTGSLRKAKIRMSSMQSWERHSLNEYYSRLNY